MTLKFKVDDRVQVTLMGTITEVDEKYASLPYKVAIAGLTDGDWVSAAVVAPLDDDEDDAVPAQQEPLPGDAVPNIFAPKYSVQYKHSINDAYWTSLDAVPEIALHLPKGDFNALASVVADRARNHADTPLTSSKYPVFRIVEGPAEQERWTNRAATQCTTYRQVVSRRVPASEQPHPGRQYTWGFFATEGAAARFVEWAAQQEPVGSDWEYCIISPYAPADVLKLPYAQFRNFVTFSRIAPTPPPPAPEPTAPPTPAPEAKPVPAPAPKPARVTVPSLEGDYTVVGHRYLVEVDGEELNDEGWEELSEALEALSDSIYDARRGTIRRCPIVLLKD